MATVDGNSQSNTLSYRVWDAANDTQEIRISPCGDKFHKTAMHRDNAPNPHPRSTIGWIHLILSKSNCPQPMAMGRAQYSKSVHGTSDSAPPHAYEVWRTI